MANIIPLTDHTLHVLSRLCQKAWNRPKALHKQNTAVHEGHELNTEYIKLSRKYTHAMQQLFEPIVESNILIREEYEDIHAELMEQSSQRYSERGVLLIGQPGIGKTLLFIYLILWSLGQKRPIVLHSLKDFYMVFGEDGVTGYASNDCAGLRAQADGTPIWVLSDYNAHSSAIPSNAFFRSKHTFIVVSTSPTNLATGPRVVKQRWVAERGCMGQYIMDIWSEDEMIRLGYLLDLDVPSIVKMTEKWGGVPRTILNIVRSHHTSREECRFEREIIDAAKQLTSSPLKLNLLDLKSTWDEGQGSMGILCIRPALANDGTPDHSLSRFCPLTQYITDLATREIRASFSRLNIYIFSLMMIHPYSRTVAGWIFEVWVHTRFTLAGSVPIPCIWPTLKNQSEAPTTVPTTDHIVEKLEDVSLQESFYWRPSASNFPGIDAILYDSETQVVYAIQATVSNRHNSVMEGLKKANKKIPRDLRVTQCAWRVLFVTHQEESGKALQQGESLRGDYWENIPVGYCVIPITLIEHAFPAVQ